MQNIKRALKTEISLSEITQIDNWWEKLSKDNQEELEEFYLQEEKRDDKIVSIFLCGEYVEQDRRKHEKDIFWINHFYDFIVNHELHLDFNRPRHIRGICSATDLAEQSIRQGIFRSGHICPLKKKNCIVEDLLKGATNKSLELYLKFTVEN